MKTFTFKYSPNEPSIATRLQEAVDGKPHVRPDELVCTSLKALLQVASESRLALFEIILKQKPSSIYDLAEKAKLSQPYVLKEVRVLEGFGLIKLVHEKDGGRERLRPEALYSKIIIDCGFGDAKEAS